MHACMLAHTCTISSWGCCMQSCLRTLPDRLVLSYGLGAGWWDTRFKMGYVPVVYKTRVSRHMYNTYVHRCKMRVCGRWSDKNVCWSSQRG
jgi:hypothetical protein